VQVEQSVRGVWVCVFADNDFQIKQTSHLDFGTLVPHDIYVKFEGQGEKIC